MKSGIKTSIAFLFIFAAANVAQAGTGSQKIESKHAWYSGTSKLGAKTEVTTKLEQKPNRTGVDGNIIFSARLFKRTYQAFRFHAVSEVKNGTARNGVSVYAGPLRIWSNVKKSGWEWKPNINQVYFRQNRSFFAGGFLLNAGYRVGGNAYGSLKLAAHAWGAGIEGRIGSNLWADVTVGLDLLAYRAGVQTKATILHGWWEADSTIGIWGVIGEFGFHFEALRVDLNLVIEKGKLKRRGWRVRRIWVDWKSLTIASWATREHKKIYLTWNRSW
jgi:hypothetical protein